MAKIAYCQCTFARDFERTLKCVELMAPYVDMVIIVADQTVSEEDVKRLKKIRDNVHVIHTEFPDDIPKFRNKYMAYAELNDVDWIVVSDPTCSKNVREGIGNPPSTRICCSS